MLGILVPEQEGVLSGVTVRVPPGHRQPEEHVGCLVFRNQSVKRDVTVVEAIDLNRQVGVRMFVYMTAARRNAYMR